MFPFRPEAHPPLRAGILALATLAGSLLLGGCLGREEAKADPVEPLRPARVVEVAYRTEVQRLTLAGTVAPRHETNLGFRVAGKIVSRDVEIGSEVRKGQILARLDAADYRHALDGARSALAAAEADHSRARADLERYAALRGTTAFVPQTFDQREAAAQTAHARLEQARSQLAMAENNLSYTVLTADSAGVVTALMAEVGQVMAQGQTLLRLARSEELEIMVSVPEQRLATLRQAVDVTFDLWSDPGKRYRAHLREISPSADPATRTFAARYAMLERPEFVGMGMTANLQIERAAEGQSAELPLTALFQQGKQPAVWVVDRASGRVALRPVTIARLREDSVSIASGIETGELVVTAGVHKLEERQKVRPVPAATASTPQQAMR